MSFILPFPPIILTFVMIFVYLGALWWLLRQESWKTLVLVAGITTLGLSLRLFQIWELPPGLNDDEIKTLKYSAEVLDRRAIFTPILNVSMLWTVLFYAPALAMSESVLWTMRIVPVVLGTLAIPASFAVGRALAFSVVPSLVGAACVASMPWAVFWSRQHWASGIIFFEAILLAALGRIIWRRGGWIDVAVGGVGLFGILYDYTGGWVMIGMPILALVIAPGKSQRIKCLGVLLVSLVTWIPWLVQAEQWMHIVTSKSIAEGSNHMAVSFLSEFAHGAVKTFRTFVYPEGAIYWTSLQGVAMHPIVVLVVAGLGLLVSLFKRSFFLAIGFLGGTVPAIMSSRGAASGHRMIACYLFISIAVAAFFEFLWSRSTAKKYRAGVAVGAAAFTAVISMQGMQIFLSPDFWKGSDGVFWYGATKVSESINLPVTKPIVVDFELARILESRLIPNPGYSVISYETLMPTAPVEYAFSPPLSVLYPLYSGGLAPAKVRTYGAGATMAFTATFGEEDVRRWQSFGWHADVLCGATSIAKVQVPALFFGAGLRWIWRCNDTRKFVYRGRWLGESTELTLVTVGTVNVEVKNLTNGSTSTLQQGHSSVNFTVAPQDNIMVTVNVEDGTQVRLLNGRDGRGETISLDKVQPAFPG